ncbi:MAG TPA: glycosyltransferase [Rhodospirillales bacterium]|nr:glycosyltransferase [Rhodospirillales bacterium]
MALSDQDGLRALGIRTPILTIPNGIDFEQIPDKLDRERAIRAFPQLAGKRIFLFLGRLDPWYKGLDVLIEAFARLTVHEAALVIVGPDSRGSLATLRRHVARLGISTKVFFVGPVFGFDKWSWLASADFFVLPSRSEGAPQAALEAMAVGKPVVLSRAASTCPDATDLGLGFIADTTPEALADVLRKACSLDRAELHRMGSRARAYVVTRHSWETTAKAVIDGYHAFCTR